MLNKTTKIAATTNTTATNLLCGGLLQEDGADQRDYQDEDGEDCDAPGRAGAFFRILWPQRAAGPGITLSMQHQACLPPQRLVRARRKATSRVDGRVGGWSIFSCVGPIEIGGRRGGSICTSGGLANS